MVRTIVLAAVVCTSSVVGRAADEPAPVSLLVAVQTGLVDVTVQGRGACSGDAVRVEVRRKVPQEVRIVVDPGTVVESESGKVQSMICHGVKYRKAGDKYRRVDVMVLTGDAPQTYLLEAFCRDFTKPTPKADNAFRLGEMDRQTTTVIVNGKTAGASLKAIQVAVWLQRGESEENVRRKFRASDADFKMAQALVKAAAASERGDSAAADQAVESVRVIVGGVFDEIRQRRAAIPFRRGDKVEVTVDTAPIKAGQRTVAEAKKGETFEVLAVTQKAARVEFPTGDGPKTDLGWIALEHLQLAQDSPRGEGRPVLRQLGELVSETELEVITITDRGL